MDYFKDLGALLRQSGYEWNSAVSPSVRGLAYDSRRVLPGDLYFALKGVYADGHDFMLEVAKRGAAAVVCEKEVSTPLPTLRVPSVLAAMSNIAHHFYGEPSHKIPIIGITGTNGKTTTTYLIEDIFSANGESCGVMGTINYRFGPQMKDAPNTTPMSLDVHQFLADMVQKKAAGVVMEVSSHALELNRVEDVQFAVGVFTNLTQDHLDFHKEMERYFQAKARLFTLGPNLRPVINTDDEYGRKLLPLVKNALPYGTREPALVLARDIDCTPTGVKFELKFPSDKRARIATNLVGRHNVENCLAAAAAMLAFGYQEEQIISGLNRNHSVPGRLERVEAGQDFVVVVDYAHTHDALAKVLVALRNTGPRRILCVFGAGGDRDRTKRPKMGRVASELSDWVYLTSDNPRSENPSTIIEEIEGGIKGINQKNYSIHPDREKAIRQAISDAKAGDILLLAGKGHETYQILGNQKIHFSDQEVARAALHERFPS